MYTKKNNNAAKHTDEIMSQSAATDYRQLRIRVCPKGPIRDPISSQTSVDISVATTSAQRPLLLLHQKQTATLTHRYSYKISVIM